MRGLPEHATVSVSPLPKHLLRQVPVILSSMPAGIHNAYGYVCDVTDESAVKALVDRIHAEVGQIDILVNNAGIIKRIPSCAQVQTRSDRLICTIFYNERLTPVGRFFSFVW